MPEDAAPTTWPCSRHSLTGLHVIDLAPYLCVRRDNAWHAETRKEEQVFAHSPRTPRMSKTSHCGIRRVGRRTNLGRIQAAHSHFCKAPCPSAGTPPIRRSKGFCNPVQTVGELWVRRGVRAMAGSPCAEHCACGWNSGTATVGSVCDPQHAKRRRVQRSSGTGTVGMSTASRGRRVRRGGRIRQSTEEQKSGSRVLDSELAPEQPCLPFL